MRINNNSLAKMIAKRRWVRRLDLFDLPNMGWVDFEDHRLFVDLGDWKGPSYHVLNWGLKSYESQNLDFLRRCLSGLQTQGSITFLDIGANIGIFSFILAKEFKNVEVHAFEPNPVAFGCLKSTFEKNFPNVHVYPVALSDKTGEAKLYFDGANHGGHSLHSNAIIEDGDEVSGEVIIRTETLDKFAANMKVDVIKLDVQRHEGRMLEGAVNTITACRPIFLMECYFADLLNPESPLTKPFQNKDYVIIEPASEKICHFDLEDLKRLHLENSNRAYCDLAFVPAEKMRLLERTR